MKNLSMSPRSSKDSSKTDEELPIPDDVQSDWKRTGRRQSVFGACANPENDDISDIQRHPKTEEQKKKILQALDSVFLFRHLDDPIKNTAAEALIPRTVKAGEVIIKQGDDGDFYYIVDSGKFEATISSKFQEGVKVKEYNDSGSFGELALMYNEPRAATITAITDGFLWALNGFDFRRIVLANAFQDRKKYDILLQKVEQLKNLTWYERSQVCDALQPKVFEDSQIIFNEGDEADGMYIIESGEVSIVSKGKELARLQSGGYFGELALVESKPRAAAAKAVGKTKVAFLEVEGFERLLGPCIDLMKKHIKDYKMDKK